MKYIDDAWVNHRDKKYKLKSKNGEETNFTIDIEKLK